jgi:hypothetical protein
MEMDPVHSMPEHGLLTAAAAAAAGAGRGGGRGAAPPAELESVVAVITQFKILRFIACNVRRTRT